MWDQFYWSGGEVHSTRDWMNPTTMQIEPKPTKMAHCIPFRDIELEHLLRILESKASGTPMLEEWQNIKKIWKYGKAVQGYVYQKSYWSRVQLPQGMHKVLTIVFYPEHIKELISILEETKTGKKKIAAKREGKELLEE